MILNNCMFILERGINANNNNIGPEWIFWWFTTKMFLHMETVLNIALPQLRTDEASLYLPFMLYYAIYVSSF